MYDVYHKRISKLYFDRLPSINSSSPFFFKGVSMQFFRGQETDIIFSIALKVILSVYDRYKIFASDWL